MTFPNCYNVSDASGTFNLVPIAHGIVIWGGSPQISNLYNCTVSLANPSFTVTITVPPTNGHYLPIATPYNQGTNNINVTNVVGNAITFTGYASTGSGQQTNATFIIFGN